MFLGYLLISSRRYWPKYLSLHTAKQLSLGHSGSADVTVKPVAILRDANVLRREGNVIPNVMEASSVNNK